MHGDVNKNMDEVDVSYGGLISAKITLPTNLYKIL
jgi:hypothetical protein